MDPFVFCENSAYDTRYSAGSVVNNYFPHFNENLDLLYIEIVIGTRVTVFVTDVMEQRPTGSVVNVQVHGDGKIWRVLYYRVVKLASVVNTQVNIRVCPSIKLQ